MKQAQFNELKFDKFVAPTLDDLEAPVRFYEAKSDKDDDDQRAGLLMHELHQQLRQKCNVPPPSNSHFYDVDLPFRQAFFFYPCLQDATEKSNGSMRSYMAAQIRHTMTGIDIDNWANSISLTAKSFKDLCSTICLQKITKNGKCSRFLFPQELLHTLFQVIEPLPTLDFVDICKAMGSGLLSISANDLLQSIDSKFFRSSVYAFEQLRIQEEGFSSFKHIKRKDIKNMSSEEWDLIIGKNEYTVLLRQITLLIQKQDGLMPLSWVDKLATQIISTAASWAISECAETTVIRLIEQEILNDTASFLGVDGELIKGDVRVEIEQIHEGMRQRKVRCHIGSHYSWLDQSGFINSLGMVMEQEIQVSFWLHPLNNKDEKFFVGSARCSVVRSLPLLSLLSNPETTPPKSHVTKSDVGILHEAREYIIVQFVSINQNPEDRKGAEVLNTSKDCILLNENEKCKYRSIDTSRTHSKDLYSIKTSYVADAPNFNFNSSPNKDKDGPEFAETNATTESLHMMTDLYFLEKPHKYPKATDDENSNIQSNESQWTQTMIQGLKIGESVSKLACSPFHTLLLTSYGSVFACGENNDGQLGLGDFLSRSSFHRIGSQDDNMTTLSLRFSCVSAGGATIGCHSAAITHDGMLYVWGKAELCGNPGIVHAVVRPERLSDLADVKMSQVSCGGGFTLALARKIGEGHSEVYSWGTRMNGRLGHGCLELYQEPNKSLKSYQYRPLCVSPLSKKDIIKVSAGDSHSLALSKKGEVYAWGKNDQGQCGIIPSYQLLLEEKDGLFIRKSIQSKQTDIAVWDDVMTPRRVPKFGEGFEPTIVAIEIVAGWKTSGAIDVDGKLWIWGDEKVNTLTRRRSTKLKRQFLEMELHQYPLNNELRQVHAFGKQRIREFSLGPGNVAAISENGSLFISQRGGDDDGEGTEMAWTMTLSNRYVIGALCSTLKIWALAQRWRIGKDFESLLDPFVKSDRKMVSSDIDFDCALVVEGERIFCHRIVVCTRSSYLSRKLWSPQDSRSSIPDIILREMNLDIVKAAVYFMYTDAFNTSFLNREMLGTHLMESRLPLFSFLNLLRDTAITLNLPKLAAISHVLMNDMGFVGTFNLTDKLNDWSLPQDMQSARKNRLFVDIKLIFDDGEDCAHRCILSARNSYFRTHLAKLTNNVDKLAAMVCQGKLDVHARFITFLYTGEIQSTKETELFEDIVLAHKYKQYDLKTACEAQCTLRTDNVVDAMKVAIEADASLLLIKACKFTICHNYYSSAGPQSLGSLEVVTRLYPELLETLMHRIRHSNISSFIMEERQVRQTFAIKSAEQNRNEREVQRESDMLMDVGDWKRLAGIVALGFAHVVLQHYISVAEAVVPLNIVSLLSLTLFLTFHGH